MNLNGNDTATIMEGRTMEGDIEKNGIDDANEKRKYKKKNKKISLLLEKGAKEAPKKIALKVDPKILGKIQYLGLDVQELFETLCADFFELPEVIEKLNDLYENEKTYQ